mgnify:CR=1 FL=1
MMILTDCDGVLVNWIKIYNEWMEEEGYHKLNSSYELHERYGLPEEESDKYIRHFNMSAEIEHLPPHKDAIKYVRKLHEEHGATFHCITALGRNKRSHVLREKNLKNLFGPTAFSKIDCVARGKHKRPVLEKYRDTEAIWVEDSIKTALMGYELGLTTFLMNHEYNINEDIPDGIIRVNSWRDIYETIFG